MDTYRRDRLHDIQLNLVTVNIELKHDKILRSGLIIADNSSGEHGRLSDNTHHK